MRLKGNSVILIVSVQAVIRCNPTNMETVQTGQLRQTRGIIAGR